MARVKIEIPSQFNFQCSIPLRITDLNYGGHVGNDRILSLIHEARVLYLAEHGYSELDLAGVSLIMADAALEYKAELFHTDKLRIYVTAVEPSSSGFELVYKLEKMAGEKTIVVAYAKTGMVCFDYRSRKVVRLPEAARVKLFQPGN